MPAAIRTHTYAFSDPTATELWVANVQKSFDDASHRVEDYRTMARQILGWIGVIIGLEINLIPKVSESLGKFSGLRHDAVWAALLTALFVQLLCFTFAALLGYASSAPRSPETPTVLFQRLQTLQSPEARQRMAAYHTKAFNNYQDAAERFSRQFNWVTFLFVGSLWLAIGAACLVFIG